MGKKAAFNTRHEKAADKRAKAHALAYVGRNRLDTATLCKLTVEQIEAVEAFALKHGAQWKKALAKAWANGTDTKEPNGHLLRQVRNQVGLNGLLGFDFGGAQ
jgi:hypothetical protein